jgi:hypothetical protein
MACEAARRETFSSISLDLARRLEAVDGFVQAIDERLTPFLHADAEGLWIEPVANIDDLVVVRSSRFPEHHR